MTHKLVALAVEAVLLDVLLGVFCYGSLVSFVAQQVIGWALEALMISELLDKIFDAYMDGDNLIVRYAGKTTAIAWGNEDDLHAAFPDPEERQLFNYGLILCRGEGYSRTQVKSALKMARKVQLAA